jgi:hypothetical protein
MFRTGAEAQARAARPLHQFANEIDVVPAVRAWLADDIDPHTLLGDARRELSLRPTVFPLHLAPRELLVRR